MTVSDGLMIAAVLLAPFAAVFAQRQVELWRERRGRRLGVFKTLMATRGTPLSPEHVQALNMIDLEFAKPPEQSVLTAWKEYRDHLNSYPRGGEDQKERAVVWSQQTQQLLATLLGHMGKCLRFGFDPVQIKKDVYSPEAHAVAEVELQLLRRFLLEWLGGDRKVLVSVCPQDEEAAKQGEQFLEAILKLLHGQSRIRVQLSPEHATEPGTPPDTAGPGTRERAPA